MASHVAHANLAAVQLDAPSADRKPESDTIAAALFERAKRGPDLSGR
jgi:hypothetical protein